MDNQKASIEREAFWVLMKEGQTCEVCRMDNTLAFIGKLHLTRDRSVVQISEAGGQPVPPVLYNTTFKIKLFFENEGNCQLEAAISGSCADYWKFTHLRPLFDREARRDFRQSVDREGMVFLASPNCRPKAGTWLQALTEEQGTPCKIKDISLGGVLLQCDREFEVGDWLILKNVQLTQDAPFSFAGQVRWKQSQKENMLSCGCQFDSLTQREQDRLFRAILSIQRETVLKRRQSSYGHED